MQNLTYAPDDGIVKLSIEMDPYTWSFSGEGTVAGFPIKLLGQLQDGVSAVAKNESGTGIGTIRLYLKGGEMWVQSKVTGADGKEISRDESMGTIEM
ncbi:hypothetical protein [Streptomyces sp. NPDC093109]|uniref:hypothetical protein n=1 Tax=Streptomyces sp. NPDC093109 TaxID=3154977 RepID=UPI00344B8B61